MISELLSKCGLNKSEQTILLHLVERGRRSAGQIAQRTGIKRPTAYAVLESLLARGLVTRQKKDGVAYFASVKVDFIPQILETQARQYFEEVKDAASAMPPLLERLQGEQVRDFAGYEISTLGVAEAVWSQLEEVFLSGDFCAIFNPQVTMNTDYAKEVVRNVLQKTAQTKPKIRELVVAGPVTDWYRGEISNPNHELRELPPSTRIISDMIFLDGAVVLSHYGPDEELGIQIKQPDFYASMIAMFELLWAQS